MSPKAAVGWTVAIGAGGALLARVWRRTRAIDFHGMSVVIVGGSRGLGLVLAREWAAEGARVVLVARKVDELERAKADLELRGASVAILPCDITDRRDVALMIERVAADYGTIDVLVNNAGIIQVGPVLNLSRSAFEEAMNTHFWGPLTTILAALPHMRRGGAQRIVNISSIGGKMAVPHLLAYSASKFALTGLSEGLGAELARDGFRVTTVCPGLMRTGSTYNARFAGRHHQEFAWFHVADALPGISIDARRAARQIMDACRHGDAELVITPAARLAVLVNAVCPGTTASVMKLVNKVLPAPVEHGAQEVRSGWESVSRFVPSALTALADRATAANNEIPAAGATP